MVSKTTDHAEHAETVGGSVSAQRPGQGDELGFLQGPVVEAWCPYARVFGAAWKGKGRVFPGAEGGQGGRAQLAEGGSVGAGP